jgi:hypothetical protein
MSMPNVLNVINWLILSMLVDITSKYYSQLFMFEYIGIKYYNYQIDDIDN